jgi:hypothetical protein
MLMLVDPETWPFGAALAVTLGLVLVQAAGFLRLARRRPRTERRSPQSPGHTGGHPNRRSLGRVPITVLVMLFLASFAVAGYAAQAVAFTATGALMPAVAASVPAALSGMGGWFAGAVLLGRSARLAAASAAQGAWRADSTGLLGRSAVVLRGVAVRGRAGEARVYDASGHPRYVMVEPQMTGETFQEGCRVVLVRQWRGTFFCTVSVREAFFDDDDDENDDAGPDRRRST